MTSKPVNHWRNLCDILNKQKKEYEKFLDLMKKKEQLLIKGDTKRLAKVVKDEEQFINKIEMLENERIKAVKLCVETKDKTPTLKDVLSTAPQEELEMLEKSSIALMEILNSVARMNRSNAELIKESLNFINYNMNLLSSDRTLDNLYEGTGRMRGYEPKIRGIINREA